MCAAFYCFCHYKQRVVFFHNVVILISLILIDWIDSDFFFCCEKSISLYILIYNKADVVALYIYRKISLLDLVCCSWWWQTKILHTMVLLSSSPSWVEMKKTLSRLTSKEYWQQLLHWTAKWGITIYFMLR